VSAAALAVDAGQTEIRAALEDERGPRVATAPGVVPFGDGVGADTVAAALLAAVNGLGELPADLTAVGVGLSGFETADDGELTAVAGALRRALGVTEVAIASDGVTSLLGALGDRSGCVVAAGTGTIVVARKGTRWAKVDGWGAILGDAGSGCAIGRAGIAAALREHDGRAGGSVALREAAAAQFGDLEGLPSLVRRVPSWSRTLASFTPAVVAAADGGDPVAAAIVSGAGADLADAGAAALARVLSDGEAGTVSCTGNVFRARAVKDAFAVEIQRLRPGVRLADPLGDSLAGAARLPGVPPEPGLVWSAA
jgi:N-acetylglucosamine kinase-like BadF-type ATPase